MRKKEKSKRLGLTIGIILLIVVIALGVVLFLDYKNYANYEQSSFFGSKDSYSQNQTLYFDDIKVTVSEVENKRYSERNMSECDKLANEAGALMRANNFIATDEWSLKSSMSQQCLDQAFLYEGRKMLIIHYFVENTSNSPIDITRYNFKITGDEISESSKPEKKITTLSAKQSRYDNFVIHDVDIKNNGPYSLTVDKNGRKKEILLQLPAIKSFDK